MEICRKLSKPQKHFIPLRIFETEIVQKKMLKSYSIEHFELKMKVKFLIN